MKPLQKGEVIRVVDRYIRRRCDETSVLDAGRLAGRLQRQSSLPRRELVRIITEQALGRVSAIRW